MKIKQGIDPAEYGFEQWASGVWYYDCEVLEGPDEPIELSFIIENDSLTLYQTNEKVSKEWTDCVFEIPKEVIRLIKDGGLE